MTGKVMGRVLAICVALLLPAACSVSPDRAQSGDAAIDRSANDSSEMKAKLALVQRRLDALQARVSILEKLRPGIRADQTEIMWRTVTVTVSGTVRSVSAPQPLSSYSSSDVCAAAVKAHVLPQRIHSNDLMTSVVEYPDRLEGTHYQCLPVGVEPR